jgi:NurA-like 5'-3' nuclease
MPHSKHASDRIRNYMGLFEVKNALKTIKTHDIDYYLYDGSLLGDLIRPFPQDKEIPQKIKYEILDLAEDYLISDINNIENKDVEISSRKIANDILNEKFEELKEYEPVNFLEYIEKLFSLSNLLKYNKKIIAISKTSTSVDYFDSKISDIAIFDKHSPTSGFSYPAKIKPVSGETEKLKREFPVEDSFFKSLKFTIFYLRLENNRNILKIELPYIADENEIRNIIGVIKQNSPEGYPYLLKKAHHDVIIKKRDIEQLFKIFGFYEKTGREML